MEKFKVMIIDSKEETEKLLKGLQEAEQIEIMQGGDSVSDSIECALASEPDVIVLDLVQESTDGFECLNKLKTGLPKAKFIVTSALNNSFYINKAIESGVDYYMLKPIDTTILAKRIVELCIAESVSGLSDEKKLEEKITNIFITVGIPAHIKGYQFLREAIKMAVHDPLIINSITKRLYPSIAKIYETSSSKVERAIRHAIEVAWNKGKIENINDVFGLKVYDTHEKPTNGEFIALVADKMILEK